MSRNNWISTLATRLTIKIVIILLAAGICSGIFAIFETNSLLEGKIARVIYPQLLPAKTNTPTTNSRIGIIEISNEDISTLGWPLPYSVLVKLVKKLKAHGSPALYQTLALSQKDKDLPSLVKVIKEYPAIVGSNLKQESLTSLTDEPPEEIEYQLLPKILMSNNNYDFSDLPLLPLSFVGQEEVAMNYRSNGFPPALDSVWPNNCLKLYISTASHDLVIPSSLFSFVNLHLGGELVTSKNAINTKLTNDATNTTQIDEYFCLKNPQTTTAQYLKNTQIIKYSILDILQNNIPLNNENIIILSVDSEKLYPDSGLHIYGDPIEYNGDQTDIKLTKYSKIGSSELYARFINEIIKKRQIRVEALDLKIQTYLVVLLMLLSSILLIKEKQLWAIVTNLVMLTCLSMYTWFQLNYFAKITIPIALFSSVISIISVCTIYTALRAWLDNTAINKITKTCKPLLELSESATSINKIIEKHLISKFKYIDYMPNIIYEEQYKYAAKGLYKSLDPISESDRLSQLKRMKNQINNSKNRTTTIYKSIPDENMTTIGIISISFPDNSYTRTKRFRNLISEVSDYLQKSHIRIHQKFLSKYLAYKKTKAEAMSSTLSHFLPDSLVSRLETDGNVGVSLSKILKPKEAKVALLQADIRGFSKLSKIYSNHEMVEHIRLYYKDVVQRAQAVAQIKIVGDCIFLFIEEQEEKSFCAVKAAYLIASDLSATTLKNNITIEDKENVNFGIAIHYGSAVIGNLSSENCIDFTVIGNEVNKVARIEELTKNETIQNLVGMNGVIISDEALEKLSDTAIKNKFKTLNLGERKISIRSFPEVDRVHYRTADCLLKG